MSFFFGGPEKGKIHVFWHFCQLQASIAFGWWHLRADLVSENLQPGDSTKLRDFIR